MMVCIKKHIGIVVLLVVAVIAVFGGAVMVIGVDEPSVFNAGEHEDDVGNGSTTDAYSVDVPATVKVQTSGIASTSAYVLYVVDGDTIAVLTDSSKEQVRVRLIGVDTPEVAHSADTESTEGVCYGEEAKEYMRSLITEQEVVLVSDPTQDDVDAYGRLLRYVFFDGAASVNELLVRQGYGREYTFKNRPYLYQRLFQEAETQARKEVLGLWGVCGE